MRKNLKFNEKMALISGILLLISLFFYFSPFSAKGAGDSTAPTVTVFSITPGEFNTENEAQTLTLNMAITDDMVGVCIPGDCGNYNSSATQVRLAPFSDGEYGVQFSDFAMLTRTSGDDKNGTYTATLTMPKGSRAGDWKVQSVLLVDKVGNYVFLDAEQLLTAVPAATGITLTNTATNSDTTAPNVTAFSITPGSFNTDSQSQTLTLNITITDDNAGVCISSDCGSYGISASSVRLSPFNDGQFGSTSKDFYNFTRTSGNDKNGTYTATLSMPKNSQTGTWKVNDVFLSDKIGNYIFLDADDLLAAVPNATGITLNNLATGGDSTAPNVTDFNIHPIEFNTESEEQTLTIDMTITDNDAGVCISGDCENYNSSPTQVRMTPLIGTQFEDFYNFTRTSGDDKNGTYTATATIPKSSKEGIWKVQSVFLADKLGNYKFLTAEQLLTALPSATGITLANTAEASEVTIEKEWTISSDTASVTFPANTVVTKKGNGSFAFYQMTNQNYNLDQLFDVDGKPASGLVDEFGNPLYDQNGDPIYDEINALTAATMRIGIPGLNLNFSQPVSVDLKVDSKYNGYRLNISSLTEDAESWTGETSCLVARSHCKFSVDHATYFTALATKKGKTATVKTPTAYPKAGTYSSSQNIALSTATTGAIIYYTTDGSAPTRSSTAYSTPIAISSNQTIKAIAVKTGMASSKVMSKEYSFRVANLTASPKAGTYSSTQTVTLSTTTEGAAIYYTTDGSTPTALSNLYTEPIVVSSNETIKSIAMKDGWGNSKIRSDKYLLKVTSPVISPNGGTYTSIQTVTISDATDGATIYYTTNGKNPDIYSAVYSSPITVSSSQTVSAVAIKAGWNNSKAVKNKYKIKLPSVADPSFSVPSGTYDTSIFVTISTSTEGAAIYYTIDGSNPTTSSILYTDPILVTSSKTIKAIAAKDGMLNSKVKSKTYVMTMIY